jgi:hypothetical protein
MVTHVKIRLWSDASDPKICYVISERSLMLCDSVLDTSDFSNSSGGGGEEKWREKKKKVEKLKR